VKFSSSNGYICEAKLSWTLRSHERAREADKERKEGRVDHSLGGSVPYKTARGVVWHHRKLDRCGSLEDAHAGDAQQLGACLDKLGVPEQGANKQL
jgi:hypothetical protein